MLNALQIEKGLQEIQKENPEATIGIAIQKMMDLGTFTKDFYAIRVCRPVDSKHSVDDVWKVILHIQYLINEGVLMLTEKDDGYGVIEGGELMRIRGHHYESIALPPIPSHDDKNATWLLISSKFEINKE